MGYDNVMKYLLCKDGWFVDASSLGHIQFKPAFELENVQPKPSACSNAKHEPNILPSSGPCLAKMTLCQPLLWWHIKPSLWARIWAPPTPHPPLRLFRLFLAGCDLCFWQFPMHRQQSDMLQFNIGRAKSISVPGLTFCDGCPVPKWYTSVYY